MDNRNDLVRWLDCFNRKERHWLLREATGPSSSNLSAEFRKKLSDALPGVPDIPVDAWWAFDYHLDWIAVALYCLADNRPLPTASANEILPIEADEVANGTLMTGNQQDVDLLVAYGSTLIAIEAKADGGWQRSQMGSKIRRLNQIKSLAGDVSIYLVLCSPRSTNVDKPRDASDVTWDGWLGANEKPYHVELEFGVAGPLFKPTRVEQIPGTRCYGRIEFRNRSRQARPNESASDRIAETA